MERPPARAPAAPGPHRSPRPRVGLQLYSVHQQLTEDLQGTLRRVAQAGFAGVETAGLAGDDAATFRRRLADLGLQHISTAVGVTAAGLSQETLDRVEALGVPRLIVNGPPAAFTSRSTVHELADSIHAAAEQLAGTGRSIGYHQHYWELAALDGLEDPLGELMGRLPGCFLELDLYWLAAARPDWRPVIARVADRVRLTHVKDGPATIPGPGWAVDPQVPAGSGAVEVAAMVRELPAAEWLVVEFDRCEGDMFEAITASRRFLVEQRLARPD